MSAQISAPIRIVALLGMLAAAAVGAYTFTVGPGGSSGGSATPSALRPVQEATSVANKLSGHNLATAQGKPDATAAAAAKPAATPAPAKTQAAAPAPAKTPAAKPAGTKPAATPATTRAPAKHADQTKTTIAALLRTHKVVVVLLYDPQAKVDQYSLAEAQLGARDANAGFIGVDVMSQHAAAPFTKAYGVLQDPSLLFFERPGKLALKLTGFVDHDVIAQAVFNVAPELAASPAAATASKPTSSGAKHGGAASPASDDFAAWQAGVNAACRATDVPGRKPLPATATDAEGAAYVRGMERQGDKMIAQVTALPLPSLAGRRAEARAYIALLKKTRSDLERFLSARLSHDAAATNKWVGALAHDDKQIKAMSQDLGLTDCA